MPLPNPVPREATGHKSVCRRACPCALKVPPWEWGHALSRHRRPRARASSPSQADLTEGGRRGEQTQRLTAVRDGVRGCVAEAAPGTN